MTTFIIILLSLLFLSCAKADLTLRLANVVYRHGDRSPATTFPTDPYQEDSWPQGWGQLSQMGMRMQYGLGQFLGNRYRDLSMLLDPDYKREEIYIRSTDVDRCLMSAESNLAGLYPPPEDIFNDPNLMWQPIPVHTVAKEVDYLLRTDGTKCPYYDELFKDVLQSDYYKAVNKENEKFFEDLKTNTGLTEDITVNNVYKIEDPLFCEQAHGRPLPKWASNETLLKLENLTNIGMAGLFGTTELARLKGGPLVKKMIQDMEDKSHNVSGVPMKFYMYSAHDTTLAAVMSAIGVYNGKQSPYASAFGVELWQDDKKEEKFYVKMWFRNSTEQAIPYNITLGDCPDLCPLLQFKDHLQDVIPVNVEAECGATYRKNYTIPILIGSSLIALILFFILMFLVCRGRSNTRKDGHTRLPQDPDV